MPLQTTTAQVLHIQSITQDILQVILKPKHYIPYEAGQYLQMITSWHEALYYSIAHAPNPEQTYAIHIRHTEETLNNQQLICSLRSQRPLTIQLPLGTCTLTALDSTRPLVFIAGGTGITPINAMIEQLLIEKRTNPITLYWLARTSNDLYMNQKFQYLKETTPQFEYIPYCSTTQALSITSLLEQQHRAPLQDSEIILAGPFNMVYALRDELIRFHVKEKYMHSDAFAFENQ